MPELPATGPGGGLVLARGSGAVVRARSDRPRSHGARGSERHIRGTRCAPDRWRRAPWPGAHAARDPASPRCDSGGRTGWRPRHGRRLAIAIRIPNCGSPPQRPFPAGPSFRMRSIKVFRTKTPEGCRPFRRRPSFTQSAHSVEGELAGTVQLAQLGHPSPLGLVQAGVHDGEGGVLGEQGHRPKIVRAEFPAT